MNISNSRKSRLFCVVLDCVVLGCVVLACVVLDCVVLDPVGVPLYTVLDNIQFSFFLNST